MCSSLAAFTYVELKSSSVEQLHEALQATLAIRHLALQARTRVQLDELEAARPGTTTWPSSRCYTTTVGGAGQLWQGSNLTGGSSGGPWVVNFASRTAAMAGGAVPGSASVMAVIGVTSWGSSDPNASKDNYSSQFRQIHAIPMPATVSMAPASARCSHAVLVGSAWRRHLRVAGLLQLSPVR